MRDLSRLLLPALVLLLGLALLVPRPALAAAAGPDQTAEVSSIARPAPPVAPAQVAIGQRAAGVSLSWTPEPENRSYEVWRSAMPFFEPGDKGAELVAATKLTAFTDTTVAEGTQIYYAIRGLNGMGEPSPLSARVGRFYFGVTPGDAAATLPVS